MKEFKAGVLTGTITASLDDRLRAAVLMVKGKLSDREQ
jgi:hypothetical protein